MSISFFDELSNTSVGNDLIKHKSKIGDTNKKYDRHVSFAWKCLLLVVSGLGVSFANLLSHTGSFIKARSRVIKCVRACNPLVQ